MNKEKKENKILEKIKDGFFLALRKIKEFFVGSPEEKEEVVTIFDDGTDLMSLSSDEVRHYSKVLHANDTKAYDKIQNGLCLVVLGSISLIVGFLFIFLSLLRVRNTIIGINYASIQFVVCVLCLAIALVLLSVGIPRCIGAHNRRKKYETQIKVIGNLRKNK